VTSKSGDSSNCLEPLPVDRLLQKDPRITTEQLIAAHSSQDDVCAAGEGALAERQLPSRRRPGLGSCVSHERTQQIARRICGCCGHRNNAEVITERLEVGAIVSGRLDAHRQGINVRRASFSGCGERMAQDAARIEPATHQDRHALLSRDRPHHRPRQRLP
jgi:hypothetical protein